MEAKLPLSETGAIIPFQRHSHDTLAAIKAAVRARRAMGINVASYFAPVTAVARVLDSFSPAVRNIVTHVMSRTRSDGKHAPEGTKREHASIICNIHRRIR
jgi:hypothetical protein